MNDDHKSKKIKKEISSTDSESTSAEFSSLSESSSYEVDIIRNKNLDADEVAFLTERLKIFNNFEVLTKCIIDSFFLRSNDVIFFPIILLDYPKLLSTLSKKFKKNINTLISKNIKTFKKVINSTSDDNLEGRIKNKMVFVFTERFCNVSPIKILNLYKEVGVEDSKLYLFLSKLYKIDDDEKEDVLNTFEEYKDLTDLDYLPYRIEEIHLVGCTNIQKNIILSDFNYRICILSGKEFKKYIELIEDDLKNNK